MRILLSALVVVAGISPAAVLAQGCNHEEKIKMSCAEGTSWDDKTKTCAPVVGS